MEEANKLQMPEETSKDSPEHVEAMVKKADEHANIKDINICYVDNFITHHLPLYMHNHYRYIYRFKQPQEPLINDRLRKYNPIPLIAPMPFLNLHVQRTIGVMYDCHLLALDL